MHRIQSLALAGLLASVSAQSNLFVTTVTEIVFANNKVCSAPIYVLTENAQLQTYTLSLDLPSTTGTEFVFTTPVLPISQAGATRLSRSASSSATSVPTSSTNVVISATTSVSIPSATNASSSETCSQDACYSAVASPTDDWPMADCSANLIATITPPPVISTQTITGETQTVTRVVSYDTTVDEFQTVTDVATIVSVDSDPVTVFLTSTAFQSLNYTSIVTFLTTATIEPASPSTTDDSSTASDAIQRRQLSPLPSYASTCGSFSAYTSACSCLGVQASTTTLQPSTSTTTQTIYPTVTSTINVGMTDIATLLTTIQSTDQLISSANPTITNLQIATQTQTNDVSLSTTILVLPPDSQSCNAAFVPSGNCGCAYALQCGQRSSAGETAGPYFVASSAECGQLCDDYNDCAAANYEVATGNCTLLSNTLTTPVADDGYYLIVYDGAYDCNPADGQVCTGSNAFDE